MTKEPKDTLETIWIIDISNALSQELINTVVSNYVVTSMEGFDELERVAVIEEIFKDMLSTILGLSGYSIIKVTRHASVDITDNKDRAVLIYLDLRNELRKILLGANIIPLNSLIVRFNVFYINNNIHLVLSRSSEYVRK